MRRHARFIVHTQNLLHGSSPFSCKSLMQNSFMQDPKVIGSSPIFGSDNSGVQTMHASGSEFLVENLHTDGGIYAIDDSSGFNCDVSFGPGSQDVLSSFTSPVFESNLDRSMGNVVDLDGNIESSTSLPLVNPCVSALDSVSLGAFNTISVLHVNIRGWRSHCDEVSAYIDLLPE